MVHETEAGVCDGVQGGAVHISSNFDSGNIEVIDATDASNIKLAIRKEPFCEVEGREHFQWFYFKVSGVRDRPIVLNITNAGASSYPGGWSGYAACCSYDRRKWFRVADTTFHNDTGVLRIAITPSFDTAYFAYFAPFTYDEHCALVAEMSCKACVRHEVVGVSMDGRDIDALIIGTPSPQKRTVWIIARQHPGESMAEHFMEGLLRRLTDSSDAVAHALLQRAVFYTVPNMNPDGTFRGHLRANARGANLNREWLEPSVEYSGEVVGVRARMQQTGVDMLVDVHGDEEIPHNFISGCEGIPSWTPRLQQLQSVFEDNFMHASKEFQLKEGYTKDAPGKANLKICANWIAEQFDCLSFTLEMPFKDHNDLPLPEQGWSPERARRLGADFLLSMLDVVPQLR